MSYQSGIHSKMAIFNRISHAPEPSLGSKSASILLVRLFYLRQTTFPSFEILSLAWAEWGFRGGLLGPKDDRELNTQSLTLMPHRVRQRGNRRCHANIRQAPPLNINSLFQGIWIKLQMFRGGAFAQVTITVWWHPTCALQSCRTKNWKQITVGKCWHGPQRRVLFMMNGRIEAIPVWKRTIISSTPTQTQLRIRGSLIILQSDQHKLYTLSELRERGNYCLARDASASVLCRSWWATLFHSNISLSSANPVRQRGSA